MKFRAKRKYGNEVITGYYNAIDGVHHYIFNNDNLNSPDWFEIDHTTLAMSTGVTDKNGTMIFGSVPVEGVMSKGGDLVMHHPLKIRCLYSKEKMGFVFEKYHEIFKEWIYCDISFYGEITITGKQYEI